MSAARSRWEYCTVSHPPTGAVIVWVTYYTPDGAQRIEHRARDYSEGTSKLWPQVIAGLGREGWELVSVDMGALYFKRPLAEYQTD